MECSTIMESQAASLTPTETLRNAAAVMRDAQIGFLPVCDGAERVVGVLTDRDIVVRALAENRSLSMAVGDIMTKNIKTCHPEDDTANISELMAQEQVSRLVVVGADMRLMGIVSLIDLVQTDSG